jgi:thiol-disulfide isomerase/thioredoxin
VTPMRQTAWVRFAAVLVLSACATSSSPPPPARPAPPPPPTVALLDAAQDIDGVVVGPAAGEKATIAIVFASWCGHCRTELRELAVLRAERSDIRYLGINYVQHEEYDGRGDAAAVRVMRDDLAPWLRVVPADEALWTRLGRPTKVPTLYIFDRHGTLAKTYDRRVDALPTFDELDRVVSALP